MKLIRMTDRRRLALGTSGLGSSFRDRKSLLPEPHAALVRAEATENYGAAVEIYRSGDSRLKEIERTSLDRLRQAELFTIADQGERPWPEPACQPSLTGAVLRRNGEYWTVGFQDNESFIKDRKGLRYVADLLRRPGIEIHVLDLVTAGRRPAEAVLLKADDASGLTIKWRPISDYLGPVTNAGPMLDRRAKTEYQRRLTELRADLEAAEAHGDEQRASRVEEETKAINRELRRAFGLRGQPRLAADTTERARVNVTRTIRLAIDRLEEVSPALGRHLDESIKTGFFCCYLPKSTQPICWRL